ncbi:WXG100 family type VII secretion target [Actinomycetaceae bacterium MB13-C1-2]|nr:WXG100 family type VII secretion target [Actinomycetaceae bacterium MB13-C1-2]
MTVYQVDSEQLAIASGNVVQSAEAIRGSVAGMMTQLQALEGSWVGTASNSFQELISRWHTTQLQVEDSLTAISSALTQASSSYAEAEGANTAMFTG